MPAEAAVPTLLTDVRLGAPQIGGALTVFPLFAARAPVLEFRSFAQAVAEGCAVKELDGGASPGDLLVINPLGVPVLLYEGEEVLGAQQNRTLDRTVLVPAGARQRVPVSCVEAHRWDSARHGEDFAPAPQAAYPALRALKHRDARRAAASGREVRADQGTVWDEVAAKSARRGVHSPTAAMADVFAHDRDAIAATVGAVVRQDGQVGALACVAGAVAVLDLVSRSDVWAALHGPLVQGYALDALDAGAAADAPAAPDAARAWLDGFAAPGPRDVRRAAGMGQDLVLRHGSGATGTALRVGDELIQLSAFPPVAGSLVHDARIGRPSRRRQP